jgi:hypothetical protein
MAPSAAEIADHLRLERRLARARIRDLMAAYRQGNVDRFLDNMLGDLFPWPAAFRAFAKLRDVPKPMQAAFLFAWCDSKGVHLRADSHAILCAALRAMTPVYTGRRPLPLFRGTAWKEHARWQYGLSWTASRSVARDFARNYRDIRKSLRSRGVDDPGLDGVVVKTMAPPAAIVCRMKYPPPVTNAERAELAFEHPNAEIVERHHEREYLVDRRALKTVTVVERLTG